VFCSSNSELYVGADVPIESVPPIWNSVNVTFARGLTFVVSILSISEAKPVPFEPT